MKGFKMDWNKQTVTITKAFAEEALIENSPASQVLKQLQAVCPNLKIVARTHKISKSRKEAKGLTYEKMERYICILLRADPATKRVFIISLFSWLFVWYSI